MSPIAHEDIANIRERFEILELELEDTLGSSNNLFSTETNSDTLSIILSRIDAFRLHYQIDAETSGELRTLEAEIFGVITKRFKEEFPEMADVLETGINATAIRSAMNFIYKWLYIGRQQLLEDFLHDYIIQNRVLFGENYKRDNIKQDLEYKLIRSEINPRNPEYCIIIMHASDLCNDVLSDDSLELTDILGFADLSEEEHDLSEELIGSYSNYIATIIAKSLMDSEFYQEFKIRLKARISNTIRAIP